MHRRSQRYFYCNYSCPFVKARLRKKSLGAIITRWVVRGSVVDPEPHCAPALGQWWVTGLWGIVTSGRRPSQNRGRNRRQGRRPQATGRSTIPPSLCHRGFSSNLHCRIVSRTCCNSLRLEPHENKKREEIKHILWRYNIIDRQRVYTWATTTVGHSAIRCYFNFNKHLYSKLPRTLAIFDGRRDRNKYMLIKDFKLNYSKITFQSLFNR